MLKFKCTLAVFKLEEYNHLVRVGLIFVFLECFTNLTLKNMRNGTPVKGADFCIAKYKNRTTLQGAEFCIVS